jgi:hypothetical protein
MTCPRRRSTVDDHDQASASVCGRGFKVRASWPAPDEFTAGTFTISDLRVSGVDDLTAVINPPGAAILAVRAATDEVVRELQVGTAGTTELTVAGQTGKDLTGVGEHDEPKPPLASSSASAASLSRRD